MTKEQLTAWIVANLTLSRTDLKFFSFVAGKVAAQQPITTAQDALWHQLLRKYYRQLRKTFADEKIKQVEEVGWQHLPVQTVRFNKLGVVDINDVAYLTIKTPYNKAINARIQSSLLHHTLRYNSSLGWYFLFSHDGVNDLLSFANSVLGRGNYTLNKALAEYLNAVRSLGTASDWTPQVRTVGCVNMVSSITETMLAYLPEATDQSLVAAKQYLDMGIQLHPAMRRKLRAKYGRDLVELTCRRKPILAVRAGSLLRVCDVVYEYACAHAVKCVAICTGSLYEDTVLETEYQSLTSRLEALGITVLIGMAAGQSIGCVPAPDLIMVSTVVHAAHYGPFYPTAKIIVISNHITSTRFINSF